MKVLVIDGGGTSTDFGIFDYESGKLVDRKTYPTSHILQVGIDKMIEILSNGINYFNINKDDYIVFGLAGYGNDSNIRDIIDKNIEKNFGHYRYLLTNDVSLAYYSEFQDRTGILIILGTGSIAYKYKEGKFARSGGWGYKLGDEASGYDVGIKLLNEFTKQADGREEKTLLYNEIRSYFSLKSDYDLISIMDKMGRKEIASLSKIAFDLYKKSEGFSIKLIDYLAEEICKMIESLCDEDVDEVVLFGGVTKSNINLNEIVSKKLNMDLKISLSKNNPLYGGYLLAKKKLENRVS